MGQLFQSPREIDALFRDAWRVVADPDEFEYVRAPKFQAERFLDTGILEGDCDDAAVFSAGILCCLGWPCSLISIRRPDDDVFTHVFTIAGQDDSLVTIDPIIPAERLPIPASDIAETMSMML